MGFKQTRPPNQAERQGANGGTRIIERLIKLTSVQEILDNSATSSADAQTQLWTPSSRLSVSFEVFFEPKRGEDTEAVNTGASAWSLSARAVGVLSDSVTLHDIPNEQAEAVPRSYEMVTGVKVLRADLDLRIPVTIPAAQVVFGVWYARAYWESNVPMSDAEFVALGNDCQLELTALSY